MKIMRQMIGQMGKIQTDNQTDTARGIASGTHATSVQNIFKKIWQKETLNIESLSGRGYMKDLDKS